MNRINSHSQDRWNISDHEQSHEEITRLPHHLRLALDDLTSSLSDMLQAEHERIREVKYRLKATVEDEAGLKIPKSSTCSIRALLFNPDVLRRALNKANHFSFDPFLNTVDGQVGALTWLATQHPEHLSQLNTCLTKLSEWMKETSPSPSTPFSGLHQDELLHLGRCLEEILSDLLGEPALDEENMPRENMEERTTVKVTDPLGVYQYRRRCSHRALKPLYQDGTSSIEIYSLTIALCALRRQSTHAGLRLCVLTHELSHWVTHLGLDTDESWWKTFQCEPKEVIESVAQDLTLRSLERASNPLFNRSSKRRHLAEKGLHAFHALNSHQSYSYRLHLTWQDLHKESRRTGFKLYRRMLEAHDPHLFDEFQKLDQIIQAMETMR